MSCNCEGNTYHIGMGCCTPVVANADNYYTKSEVDEKIDEITISGGGITTGEVQSMIDASVSPIEGDITALNGQVGQLSTDMENKAEKSDIPSLEGYATQQWVNGKGYITELKTIWGFSTLSDPIDLAYGHGRHNDVRIESTDVVVETRTKDNGSYDYIIPHSLKPIAGRGEYDHNQGWVNGLFTQNDGFAIGRWNDYNEIYDESEDRYLLPYFSIGNGTDDNNRHNIFTILENGKVVLEDGIILQNWLSEVDDVANRAASDVAGKQDALVSGSNIKTINGQSLLGSGNITISGGGSADLSNYYNKQEVDDKLGLKANTSDLSALNTTVEQLSTSLENKANKSEIPSLAGYATEQWVENKHYLTEHQSLNGYATQEWVGNQGYLTEHQTLKTINNQSIVGEGNITITAETPDLSNYYTKTEADNTFAEQELLDTVNNRVNTHTGNTNIHVTATEKETWNNKVDSSTLNNYMLKTQIWCGTQAEYDALTTKDNEVIYLIHA